MSLDHVDVVLLRWRESPAMLRANHRALAGALPEDWAGTATVVLNAAAPATTASALALLDAHHPTAHRQVLRFGRNAGFARAMDLALDRTPGHRVLLLNSDAEPAADMVATLDAALDERPDAIWAAPAIHGPGEPCHPPGAPYADARLHGMALLVDRRRFLAAGGFDPQHFFYGEDDEASDRLRAQGWTLLRVPGTQVWHGKGGRSRRGVLVRELHYARSRQLTVHREAPRRRDAVRAVATGRARSVAAHARAGDWPGVAGLLLALASWPGTALRAEARRRRPWDGPQLEAWLQAHRADAALEHRSALARPRAAARVMGAR